MATKAQIAERVLHKLMVLEHGETMDTGDQLIVENAYDSSWALLDADSLVTWGSTDDKPTGAELPIIDYVADKIKGAFSVPIDIRQTLPQEAFNAERSLSVLIAADYVSDVTEAEYF